MPYNSDKRLGYINGQPIIGYDEVTMEHIAAFVVDLWGIRRSGTKKQFKSPCKRNYMGPRGKWRDQKRILLDGESVWYMHTGHETGRKVSTIEPSKREGGHVRDYSE